MQYTYVAVRSDGCSKSTCDSGYLRDHLISQFKKLAANTLPAN